MGFGPTSDQSEVVVHALFRGLLPSLQSYELLPLPHACTSCVLLVRAAAESSVAFFRPLELASPVRQSHPTGGMWGRQPAMARILPLLLPDSCRGVQLSLVQWCSSPCRTSPWCMSPWCTHRHVCVRHESSCCPAAWVRLQSYSRFRSYAAFLAASLLFGA